jgi:hypothetical protein
MNAAQSDPRHPRRPAWRPWGKGAVRSLATFAAAILRRSQTQAENTPPVNNMGSLVPR